MSMTEAKINYNFHENFIDVDLRKITNSSGAAYIHMQLVYEDGFFGEVREFDGIADSETGYINIFPKRKISTTQIDLADTFVLGSPLYFDPVTELLEDADAVGAYKVGFVTKVNNGVCVEFQPFAQDGRAESVEMTTFDVDADATGSLDITGIIPEGATIIDVLVECTTANSAGTLQLREETGDAAITDAIICAVDNVIERAASISISTVGSNGLEIISNGAADRGLMTIVWRI